MNKHIELTDGTEIEFIEYKQIVDGLQFKIKDIKFDEVNKVFTNEQLEKVKVFTEFEQVANLNDHKLGNQIIYESNTDSIVVSIVEKGVADQLADIKSKLEVVQTSVDNQKTIVNAMDNLMTTEIVESDKHGYNWKVTKIGDVEVLKEYVKNDSVKLEHSGNDYTDPAFYKVGDAVTVGKWYCEESNPLLIFECINSGVPMSFKDTLYFDVVE